MDEQNPEAVTEQAFSDALAAFSKDDAPPAAAAPVAAQAPTPVVEGDEPETPKPEVEPEGEPAGEAEAATEAKTAATEIPEIEALRRKIDNLERDNQRNRQQAAYWMQNYQQRAAQPDPQKPEAAPPPLEQFLAPKPKLGQFETTDQWEDAVFKWMEDRQDHRALQIKQQIFQEQNKQQTERQQQEYRAAKVQYEQARAAEGAKKYGNDFSNAADYLSTFVVPGSQMYETIFRLEGFPEVVVELGRNRAEAERISRLDPEDQIYQLKDLDKNLRAKAELARKAQPKLPTRVEAPGQGEDLKTKPSTTKLRMAAKASGELKDWAKVFMSDPTM